MGSSQVERCRLNSEYDGLTRVLLHGAYALQRSMQPKGNIVTLRNLPCIKC